MGLTSRIYFFMNSQDIDEYFKWLCESINVGFVPADPVKKEKLEFEKVYHSIYDLKEYVSFEGCKYGQSMENGFYIKFLDLNQEIVLTYIKEQDYYLIDQGRSKVAIFSCGGIYKENILISGCIDVYKKYFDSGFMVEVPEVIPLFRRMVSFIKKRFITKAANQYYVMPGAYELAKKGYKLKVEKDLAFGFHIGKSGGLEGYYEDKGIKITDDGILTSQVDWSEEAKRNIWKEFPDC